MSRINRESRWMEDRNLFDMDDENSFTDQDCVSPNLEEDKDDLLQEVACCNSCLTLILAINLREVKQLTFETCGFTNGHYYKDNSNTFLCGQKRSQEAEQSFKCY